MHPSEYLEVSHFLLDNLKKPGGVRSAVSRAYYAAFQTACQFLENLSIHVPASSGHGEVRNGLGNSGDVELAQAGSSLGTLQSKRIDADYRLNNVPIENAANAWERVHEAEDVILAITKCKKESARAAIVGNTIKAWRDKIEKGIPQ